MDNICGDLDFEDGGNPVVMNRVMAACDPVLVDAYVCQMMHYEVAEVPYVKLAGELGVGCSDISKADVRFLEDGADQRMPVSRKVVELADAVEEVESCSACYGYLIPALEMLKEEGLFEKLDEKSASGRGIVVRRECLVWDTVPVSFRIMWKGVRRWRGIYMSF